MTPKREGTRLQLWRVSKDSDRAWCGPLRHPVTGANVDDGGGCRACRLARGIVRGLRGSGEKVLPGDLEMWATEMFEEIMKS